MLAALVNPVLFWSGAGAVAAPILIHLLARRRFRRVRWAAMRFLLDAERRNRRHVRLEEMILLLLRCLAVLLIALVLGRPFVRPTGAALLLGRSDRTERIFLLDDSLSMSYVNDEGAVFDRARLSVARLVRRLREFAPQDSVTLLRMSDPSAPVVTGAVLDEQQVEQLLVRLEALQPTQQPAAVPESVDAVREVLDQDESIHSAVVYVVSDFQQVDWVQSASGASLAARWAEWAADDQAIRAVLIDVGDDEAENASVTDCSAGRRQIIAGVESQLTARVANFAPRSIEKISLEVDVAGAPRAGGSLARVAPGATEAVGVGVRFERAGDTAVRVALPPDALPADDQRFLAVEVSEALKILVVNGEPSSDTYDDETHLLVTALQPEGSVRSGNQVKVIDDAALEETSFDDYHLVALCNLYRVSEPVAEALHRYVLAGGGLAVFLGDQVSDPRLYNATLYREGAGLLPAELRSVISASDPGVSLAADDFLHPVVRIFSGSDNPFMKQITFRRYFELAPTLDGIESAPDGAGSIAADEVLAAGAASGLLRSPPTVVARFNDAEQRPAIVERRYGRGRVMIMASTCDLEWNDWGRDPSYVVTMLEIAQHLARASDASRAGTVGEPLAFALDPSIYLPQAEVQPPGYPEVPGDEIAAVASAAGGFEVRWPHTDRAGVYTVMLRRRDGAAVPRRFAVNLEPAESDLTPADEPALRAALAGVPVEYVAGVAAAEDDRDTGRRELWPVLLAMAMGTLMVEQYLACRFGRR